MSEQLRKNIWDTFSWNSPEAVYFQSLCDMEDADKQRRSALRLSALDYGVKLSGNPDMALKAADLFLEFLDKETKTEAKA